MMGMRLYLLFWEIWGTICLYLFYLANNDEIVVIFSDHTRLLGEVIDWAFRSENGFVGSGIRLLCSFELKCELMMLWWMLWKCFFFLLTLSSPLLSNSFGIHIPIIFTFLRLSTFQMNGHKLSQPPPCINKNETGPALTFEWGTRMNVFFLGRGGGGVWSIAICNENI